MLALPLRGPEVRQLGLPLPPARMPLWRRGSALKRWRYVGVYTPDLLLCVGHARIGPISQRWWAVAEPGGALHEGNTRTGREVTLDGSSVRIAAAEVQMEIALELDGAEGVETASPVGDRGNYIWTSKRAGIGATGTVVVAGRRHRIDGPHGFVDDSAGYHARHTRWRWSAGLGRSDDGRLVGWNLVAGIHDAEAASERTLWVDGHASELGPVRFADDLSSVSFAGGEALRFAEWAAREEHTNLLVVRSSYRQPFGTFSGELPGNLRLAEGHGVMEHHDVWW